MVYTILVAELQFDEKTRYYQVTKTNDKIIFSNNWKKFQKIWYIRDHLFNLNVIEALSKLKHAEEYFEEKKIPIGVPDDSNPDWIWGIKVVENNNVPLPEEQCLSIFRYLLIDLQKKIKPFNTSYLLDIEHYGAIIRDNVKYRYFSQDPDDSNDDSDNDISDDKQDSNSEKATEDHSYTLAKK